MLSDLQTSVLCDDVRQKRSGNVMPHGIIYPLCLDELDAETLRAEMQKGLDDFTAGRIAELSDFQFVLEREGRV